MSQTITPVEKKLDKIDEISENMILSSSSGISSTSFDMDSFMAYIDESATEEKLAMLINRIRDNNSKLNDLETVSRNISALDNPAFEGVYGRNLPTERRAMIREGLEEENHVNYQILKDMNLDYNNLKDNDDYLSIKVERTDKGKTYFDSVYGDFRKYTDSQIESDIMARTIYHMIMEQPKDLSSLLGNPVVRDSVKTVLGGMKLEDLEEVVKEDNGISNILLEDPINYESTDELIRPLDKNVFNEILSEVNLQRQVEEVDEMNNDEITYNDNIETSDDYYGITQDDYGFEENDDDMELN